MMSAGSSTARAHADPCRSRGRSRDPWARYRAARDRSTGSGRAWRPCVVHTSELREWTLTVTYRIDASCRQCGSVDAARDAVASKVARPPVLEVAERNRRVRPHVRVLARRTASCSRDQIAAAAAASCSSDERAGVGVPRRELPVLLASPRCASRAARTRRRTAPGPSPPAISGGFGRAGISMPSVSSNSQRMTRLAEQAARRRRVREHARRRNSPRAACAATRAGRSCRRRGR